VPAVPATSVTFMISTVKALHTDVGRMVLKKLCTPADADCGRAAAEIEASAHAKDHYINNDAIRILHTASVDVLW
jgi:hypothetical protein